MSGIGSVSSRGLELLYKTIKETCMSNIAVFYGSTTGNTESAAKDIAQALGARCFSIDSGSLEKFADFDVLILGSSTWGLGDLQDDWDALAGSLPGLSLSGKKVAFFGLGDQESYSDTFADAMGLLKAMLVNTGAAFIGAWPSEGYSFETSASEEDGLFVGLALDEDNQSGETAGRIAAWTERLKKEIG